MLKEIIAILTAKCIYAHFDHQIYLWYVYIIVDYRVGIFPFSVTKCDVTDMLPYGTA